MRPPAIQAERASCRRPSCSLSGRFNEAACNTGGTPRASGWASPEASGFNEAACNTGGTPASGGRRWRRCASFNEAACNTGGTPRPVADDLDVVVVASMRPPAIQAERDAGGDRVVHVDLDAASMRPPAIQAERAGPAALFASPRLASMRPPAIQAERAVRGAAGRADVRGASMRPPAIQAER